MTISPTQSSFLLKRTHPDHGYAWIIVFCGFMLYLIVDGISYNLGLINSAWLDEFKESETATSWIGSIFYAIPLLTAPITAQLVENFSCRKITIVFGLISALGFIVSSFAGSVVQLYITIGLISGFGVSAAYVVGILSVERWFKNRRTFGIGIVSAGTGVGTSILPPLTQMLLDKLGWRITMFFLAGLVGTMSLIGFFITEPQWTDAENPRNSSNQQRITNLKQKLKKIFSHFGKINFVLLAISTFIIYATYNVPVYFMVELLKNYDYTDAASANYLSVIGFFLTCGMIALGYIGDISGKQIKNINALCVLICGLSISLMPSVAENVLTLAICCATFGFTFASAYVLIPKIAELIVGVEEFPSALGLNFFVQGLGCLIGPPFASTIYEILESWKLSFEICGFILGVSSIFAVSVRLKRQAQF
ncbi:hypothetical protein PVAND_016865 [Polypedilum vanderplanki]|uniref:Major facilitator superfamily (MFS) profile domain-containing protein n=1 Tax=Polypedilum vanderplanki TaxID=319348 RepID=A0A9J6BHA3_POLVA|nr:hypothetical protein PVAND_016865 [Polypedilum vanderplanki]